jgi:uncharacterized damage-inducible protein DinB
MKPQPKETSDQMRDVLLETYAVNDAMNQLLLERLDPRAWRARPASRGARSIAAIFAHMHSVRRKWLRLSAPHLKLPAQLDRTRCTQREVRAALAESAKRCSQMLGEALASPTFAGPAVAETKGRFKQFLRDGWARPWPGGAAMFAYMFAHDVHHRGQICMLAHQLGFPIKAGYEIWHWEKLWKQSGFTRPR